MSEEKRFEVDVKIRIPIDNLIEICEPKNSEDIKKFLKTFIEANLNDNICLQNHEIISFEFRDLKNQGWLCSNDEDEINKVLKRI